MTRPSKTASPRSDATRGRRRDAPWGLLVVALLVAASLFLYVPLFSQTPVIDDGAVVFDNPAVTGNAAPPAAPYYTGTYRPLWRPLATLSLRWNWQVAGSHKPAFQAVNLILLLASVYLVYVLLRRMGTARIAAGLVVGILLVHPANAESVLRLAGRSELLAVPLMLAALLLFVGLARGPRPVRTPAPRGSARYEIWIYWSLLFLLGLLSSEIALLLPLLAIGGALTVGTQQADQRSRFPLTRTSIAVGICLALALLWAGARDGVLHGWPAEMRGNPAPNYLAALSAGERIQHALSLPAVYLRTLFDPAAILPDYAHLLARPAEAPPVILGDPHTFGVRVPRIDAVVHGVLVLGVGALVFLLARRRLPLVAFGAWVFTIGLLAPLPLLSDNGHVASARHLFLPLFGLLAILLGLSLALAARLPTHKHRPLYGALLLLVLILTLGLMAATRSVGSAWKTHDGVVARLAASAPLSPEVPLQRAAAALRRSRALRAAGDHDGAAAQLDRAAGYYEEAIALFPRMPRPLLNLGLIRAEQGQISLAGRALRDAAVVAERVFPGSHLSARAYVALGAYYGQQGQDDRALLALRQALQSDSTNVQALARAGLLEAARPASARSGLGHIRRALELDRHAGTLGRLSDQLRGMLQRGERYLHLAESDSVAYREAMRATGAGGAAPDESPLE